MAFYREASEQPFTVIANQSLQDPGLSFEATGLLAFMLSLPANWKYSRDWLMQQKQKIGRDKLKRLLKELEENGYLERKYSQDEKGRMAGHDWIVKPVNPKGDGASTDGLKTRPPVFSAVEKTAPINKTVLQSKQQVSQSTVRARENFSADESENSETPGKNPKNHFFTSDPRKMAEQTWIELQTTGLCSGQERYAQLKILEYQERFPDSKAVADCFNYVKTAIEHQHSLIGT